MTKEKAEEFLSKVQALCADYGYTIAAHGRDGDEQIAVVGPFGGPDSSIVLVEEIWAGMIRGTLVSGKFQEPIVIDALKGW